MEELGSRLREYLDFKGVKRALFSSECDIPYNSLTRILNNSRNVSSDVLNKIFIYFPELNARWLITGKGPMEYSINSYIINEEDSRGEVKVSKKIENYQHLTQDESIVSDSALDIDTEELLKEFIEKDEVREAFRKMVIDFRKKRK